MKIILMKILLILIVILRFHLHKKEQGKTKDAKFSYFWNAFQDYQIYITSFLLEIDEAKYSQHAEIGREKNITLPCDIFDHPN